MGPHHVYTSLSTDEDQVNEPKRISSQPLKPWKITVLVLAILNVLLVSHVAYTSWWPRQEFPFSTPIPLRYLPVLTSIGPLVGTALQYHAYGHFTNYSSTTGEDTKEIQSLWDRIEGGHGIVALNKEWAKSQHLTPALSLPSDATKGVYAIDGYHEMHCLVGWHSRCLRQHTDNDQKLLRESFYKLYRNDPNPFAKSFDHYSHCFDYIRQSIMCTASDHLFATAHGGLTGDGEIRRCRDWQKLREFAADHSACDKNDIHHMNDFLAPNLCHGSSDGLPDPN